VIKETTREVSLSKLSKMSSMLLIGLVVRFFHSSLLGSSLIEAC